MYRSRLSFVRDGRVWSISSIGLIRKLVICGWRRSSQRRTERPRVVPSSGSTSAGSPSRSRWSRDFYLDTWRSIRAITKPLKPGGSPVHSFFFFFFLRFPFAVQRYPLYSNVPLRFSFNRLLSVLAILLSSYSRDDRIDEGWFKVHTCIYTFVYICVRVVGTHLPTRMYKL